MKTFTSKFHLGFAALSLVLFVTSCKDKTIQEHTYTVNTPVYMSHEEFENQTLTQAPRELEEPGKIHIKGSTLFIVELRKGIHVVDNSDPSSPQNVAFIKLPGIVDLASKDFILYADSYTDLVALDVSDIQNIKQISRITSVFDQSAGLWSSLPITNNQYPVAQIDPSKGVVVGWKVETITEEYEINSGPYGCYDCMYFSDNISSTNEIASVPTSLSSTVGMSGSMARFAVAKNALYVLDNWTMKVFDVSTSSSPDERNSFNPGLQVETLFPMGDNLFVGTTSGMMIYDISNPFSPNHTSTFTHATSCDPVVVEGNIAYVTLRSGTQCQGFNNQLDVIDVSDFSNPQLIKSYPMTNPHGLGIDNGTLFICDGADGLKVFDANDSEKIDQNQLSHFANIDAYDVIPLGDVLLMIGKDGFYQYDYTDLQNIKLISTIPVFK